MWYAFYLTALARFDEAEAEAKLALQLDALALSHNAFFGWVLYFARRYDRAVAQFRATIELEPHYFMAYWGLGWALIQQGDSEAASAALRQGQALGGGTETIAALCHAYAKAGREEEARQLLAELYELARQRTSRPFTSAWRTSAWARWRKPSPRWNKLIATALNGWCNAELIRSGSRCAAMRAGAICCGAWG